VKLAGKLTTLALVLLGAAGILVALYVHSRSRALASYCRNNLRQLGVLASINWERLEDPKTGRLFWQRVREAQFKDIRGHWLPLHPDPFVCPVLGKTRSRPEDPATIDYLGPQEVQAESRQRPKTEPLGADRPGNHPDGGNVLWLDGSSQDLPSRVEPRTGQDPRWAEALRALKE
jgi:prepilin-type processing-associated H-X9-DG protein